MKEIVAICSELKVFVEEQWQLHDSLLDSEKATEMMAINMGLKQGKLSSLLEYNQKLESFNFLTDKEEKIKQINGKLVAFSFPCAV
jgi:hypothetical protein